MKIIILIVGARRVVLQVPTSYDVRWTKECWEVFKNGILVGTHAPETDPRVVEERIRLQPS